jgi:hypothetical protein
MGKLNVGSGAFLSHFNVPLCVFAVVVVLSK